MSSKRKSYGVILVLLAAFCFGAGAIIIKSAYNLQLTSWEFITVQFLFSLLMLGALYIYRRYKKLEAPLTRRRLFRLALLGATCTLGTSTLYIFGLQYLDASVGIILFYTYPAFTALGASLVFREKLHFRHYLCLGLTVAGIVCTVNPGSLSLAAISLKGSLMILGCSLCYTAFALYCDKKLTDASSLEITTFTQLFAALAYLMIKPPLFLLQGVSGDSLFLGFLMAFFTVVLSYLLMLKGITIIGASKASIISTAEIPFTFILAMFILGETVTLLQVIGALLIVMSIVFLDIQEKTPAPVKG